MKLTEIIRNLDWLESHWGDKTLYVASGYLTDALKTIKPQVDDETQSSIDKIVRIMAKIETQL